MSSLRLHLLQRNLLLSYARILYIDPPQHFEHRVKRVKSLSSVNNDIQGQASAVRSIVQVRSSKARSQKQCRSAAKALGIDESQLYNWRAAFKKTSVERLSLKSGPIAVTSCLSGPLYLSKTLSARA